MITRELFLKKYNITEELFQSAGISWEELCDIYDDFVLKKDEKYQKIMEEFFDTYLKDMNKDKSEDGKK